MNHERILKIIDSLIEFCVRYSFQILGAAIILLAAWILAHFVSNITRQALRKKKIDITIEKFIVQFVGWAILVLGFLLALGSLGVQVAPLIAGLSVAGVGAGLALQGPLSNYASGATLIFTKPFKVGDIIEIIGQQGVQGVVKDISLPRTELIGLDGSSLIVPNKHIIGEVIKNYSEYRKVEFQVDIAYDQDPEKALAAIEQMLKNQKEIVLSMPIQLGIKDFGANGINLHGFFFGYVLLIIGKLNLR